MSQTKKTVGQAAIEAMQQEAPTRDPIEIQREVHKEYIDNIRDCVRRHEKHYEGDFYVEVITKKERLLENVLRNYFFSTRACPTPTYDQAVYKYHRESDSVEFLWVVPSKDTCQLFLQNIDKIVPEEQQLLEFVVKFTNGELLRYCKTLNNEQEASDLLQS